MSPALKDKILDEAHSLADEDGEITREDRRKVIFYPIHDLESVLSGSTEEDFLAYLKAACEERYAEWDFQRVYRQESESSRTIKPNDFPFHLDSILPCRKRINEQSG